MKIRQKLEIDAEMDTFRVRFRKGAQDVGQRLEAVFHDWFAERERQRICDCSVKGFWIGYVDDQRNRAELSCGWFCDACLDLLGQMISERLSEVTSVSVGSDRGPYPAPETRFLSMHGRTAWFEDGRAIVVPKFSIRCSPITIGEFQAFTDATGYVTTAERGDDGSFRMDETIVAHAAESRRLAMKSGRK